MLLLYIIKQPPFFKVQKSRRVVSYKKHMTKRGYAFVDNSGLRLRYQNKYNQHEVRQARPEGLATRVSDGYSNPRTKLKNSYYPRTIAWSGIFALR